jgi:hypothetical protein
MEEPLKLYEVEVVLDTSSSTTVLVEAANATEATDAAVSKAMFENDSNWLLGAMNYRAKDPVEVGGA